MKRAIDNGLQQQPAIKWNLIMHADESNGIRYVTCKLKISTQSDEEGGEDNQDNYLIFIDFSFAIIPLHIYAKKKNF